MVTGVMVEIVITDGGCVLVFSVMQWWLAIYAGANNDKLSWW